MHNLVFGQGCIQTKHACCYRPGQVIGMPGSYCKDLSPHIDRLSSSCIRNSHLVISKSKFSSHLHHISAIIIPQNRSPISKIKKVAAKVRLFYYMAKLYCQKVTFSRYPFGEFCLDPCSPKETSVEAPSKTSDVMMFSAFRDTSVGAPSKTSDVMMFFCL